MNLQERIEKNTLTDLDKRMLKKHSRAKDFRRWEKVILVEEAITAAKEYAEETVSERDKYKNALESIANEEGSCCQRCEGNGSLWADGGAHLPSYGGATIRCGNCGGEGRVYEDVKQIAIDALATDKDGE